MTVNIAACDIPSIGPVYPHFVDLCRVLTEILDMTQDMAPAVLTNEIAYVSSICH